MQSAITIGCDEKGNTELSLWRIINFEKDNEEWKLIIKTKRYHDILRIKKALDLNIEQITLQDSENEFSLVPIQEIHDKPELWTGSNRDGYVEQGTFIEQLNNGDYKVEDEYGNFHVSLKDDFTLSNEC